MSCSRIRDMFGAYWDDEITQAEREWIETHFTSCPPCRVEYESFARTLELVASLPREEAAPDLVERVMNRTRRLTAPADRLPVRRVAWVPATAVAALVALALVTLSPWSPLTARHPAGQGDPAVSRVALAPSAAPQAPRVPERRSQAATQLAAAADSLFDHSEDVEFILDPVTVRRGHVHPAAAKGAAVQGERAVITF